MVHLHGNQQKSKCVLETKSLQWELGQRVAGQHLDLGETQGSKLQELPGRAHDHNLVGVQLELEGLILLLLT